MSRDLITGPDAAGRAGLPRPGALPRAARALLAAAAAALLVALAYQVPARHDVDVGGRDSGYALGFHDPERAGRPGAPSYLEGSDGGARWTRAESFLLFPQAGLPARLTLRLRGRPAPAPPVPVTVLVNGEPAASLSAGPDWQEVAVPVRGGLLKPEDVLVAIRAGAAPLGGGDGRRVGVLVDRATLDVGPPPVLPYPSQLIYAAVAGGLLAALARWRWRPAAAAIALLALAFLLLYRLQPPYPLPLRGLLPAVCALLAAWLAVRHAGTLARLRRLPDALALGGVAAWCAAVLAAAGGHLVLSVPGVEKDFRVFATRATPAEIFRADGFYNLGYPLLLWLARPLAEGNAFLAARLVAALSGALLLLSAWALARRLLGPAPALVALAALALSPMAVQYALYVGSDMPFAALCALALALLHGRRGGAWRLAAAGLAAGCAFLVRHPGLALLPAGWLAIAWLGWGGRPLGWRASLAGLARPLGAYTLAFLIAVAPQVAVNLRDTGQPLYSQQAKNIWLAVFGDGDWGRWGEAANDVSAADVLLQDPGRFAANLSGNLRAFAGTGAEDQSEFGRAIQLRLLGFPANWLAVAGLLGWLWALARRRPDPAAPAGLLGWVAIYALTVAVGFALQRFFLPLAAAYAVAAAWALARAGARYGARAHLALGLALAALLWGGFGAGASAVLRPAEAGDAAPGQPADALGAARLALAALGPGERLAVRVPADDDAGLALAKYSAVAHRVAPGAGTAAEDVRGSGAALLLWSERLGAPPPVGPEVGRSGQYALYRVQQ